MHEDAPGRRPYTDDTSRTALSNCWHLKLSASHRCYSQKQGQPRFQRLPWRGACAGISIRTSSVWVGLHCCPAARRAQVALPLNENLGSQQPTPIGPRAPCPGQDMVGERGPPCPSVEPVTLGLGVVCSSVTLGVEPTEKNHSVCRGTGRAHTERWRGPALPVPLCPASRPPHL